MSALTPSFFLHTCSAPSHITFSRPTHCLPNIVMILVAPWYVRSPSCSRPACFGPSMRSEGHASTSPLGPHLSAFSDPIASRFWSRGRTPRACLPIHPIKSNTKIRVTHA
ncbi:hypothetical protein OG21DRAFT_422910 [Imleria badia]|nr:hypothetical protein OG21DRAFT_422910 [Imleria badia]